jgi:hypothetical protein
MERRAAAAGQFSAWKWALPLFCALGFVALAASVIDVVGLGGRPWYGFWNSLIGPTGQPYIMYVADATPGGATWRAGLRDGDRIDLRRQEPEARVAVIFQLLASQTTTLHVQRGSRRFDAHVLGGSVFEGDLLYNIPAELLAGVGFFLLLGCAWLVALRRWPVTEARYLCLALICVVFTVLDPTLIAVPNAAVGAWLWTVSALFYCASALLPVVLGARFGIRSIWRKVIDAAVFASAAVVLTGALLCTLGMLTLIVDPFPFGVAGTFLLNAYLALFGLASISVVAAVASTDRFHRSTAAWLLLPLPTALLVMTVVVRIPVGSVYAYQALWTLKFGILVAAAATITYALLKRRVLDLNFIIGRTLVIAGVSAIVVVSFVLLEWLLNTVLSGTGHVTGLAANALLALVLGLSLQMIHRRVDRFVDFAFFHKRYENERALLEFAAEAAFITERDALLDQAIDNVAAHTDACKAALLLSESGAYVPLRSFGFDAAPAIDENDPAVLALKSRHRPVDLHCYGGSMKGDLAVPMLGRGRLLGVLLMGERTSGEAYAPDEVEALTRFAHGIAVTLDSFSSRGAESLERLEERMVAMQTALLELREAIARDIRGTSAPL